jgi:hypothetical protein
MLLTDYYISYLLNITVVDGAVAIEISLVLVEIFRSRFAVFVIDGLHEVDRVGDEVAIDITLTFYDLQRGFDPVSEDDMDDNGMSRYLENNDEEGWD